MANLTEETVVSSVDVDEYRHVGVLRKILIKKDGELRTSENQRVRYAPGDDDGIAIEEDWVRAIADAVWTPEVRQEYKNKMDAIQREWEEAQEAAEEEARKAAEHLIERQKAMKLLSEQNAAELEFDLAEQHNKAFDATRAENEAQAQEANEVT